MIWNPTRRRAQLTSVVLGIIILLLYVNFEISRRPIKYDPSYGLLHQTSPSSKVAIATFLCESYVGSDENAPDNYFFGARTLNYQLKHAATTRLNRVGIPFLVIVTKAVSVEKRLRLEKDGATVVVVDDVELPWWVKTGVTKWKDQFTKLRIFEMVEYERILFIDADTLITRPIDSIFDEMIVQRPAFTMSNNTGQIKSDEARLPVQYVFSARSDNALTGERDHPYPPTLTNVFSAGFWMAAPSREMFNYLLSVMQHRKRFDPHTMEQSLLNYAFRRDGPMPWFELEPKWSATWPNKKDLKAGVATLHEKWWVVGPEDLRAKWEEARRQMEEFFDVRD